MSGANNNTWSRWVALFTPLAAAVGVTVWVGFLATRQPEPLAVPPNLIDHEAIVAKDRMIESVEKIARRLDDMSRNDDDMKGTN